MKTNKDLFAEQKQTHKQREKKKITFDYQRKGGINIPETNTPL